MFNNRTPKEVILLYVSLLAAIAILVFTVIRIVQQDYVMVMIDLGILATMLFVFGWTYFKHNVVVGSYLFILFALVGVIVTIYQKGESQILWAFPTTIMTFYIVSLRLAAFFSVVMLLAVSATLYNVELNHPLSIFAVTFPLTTLLVGVSVNHLNHANKQLRKMVKHDVLTGVLNRLAFNERVESLVNLQQRHPSALCLMIFDLDNFKVINDTRGHLVGDDVLIEFTQLIESRLRKTDEFYRYGGEEFVLIPYGESIDDAQAFAEILRQLIAESSLYQDYQLTVSCGVAQYCHGETVERWLERADKALYQAKNTGKNTVCAAEPSNAPAVAQG